MLWTLLLLCAVAYLFGGRVRGGATRGGPTRDPLCPPRPWTLC